MTEENINASPQNASTQEMSRGYVKSVIAFLDEDNEQKVRELITDLHVADLAELISNVSRDQREQIITIIKENFNADILLELESSLKEEVLGLLSTEQVAEAISQLDVDDAIDILEEVEEGEQQVILDAISDQKQREEVTQGLSYPEDSAGRLMNPEFATVPHDWTVGQIIDYMRSEDNLPEDFYTLFVLDDAKTPIGYVLVSRVIRQQRDVPITEIMYGDLRWVDVTLDQEEVARIFIKYSLASAPVLDENNTMVGVITIDDVVNVVTEEAEEDIMKLGGIDSTDIYASAFQTCMQRFPWLFVNLLTAIAASIVIAVYQNTIQALVVLAVLMPIVASMAGNAGTQTLTVAVRGLATRELSVTNAMRVVRKEILASIFSGVAFGIIMGLATLIIYQDQTLALILASATFGALIMAALSGALIPLALSKMGADPAISSSVFVTTVTDLSGFFFFLGLATLFLL